jgi:hypothetical protein
MRSPLTNRATGIRGSVARRRELQSRLRARCRSRDLPLEPEVARRHHLNPWAYLTHVLSELPTRSAADLTDLLPDAWVKTYGGAHLRVG